MPALEALEKNVNYLQCGGAGALGHFHNRAPWLIRSRPR
jgi:hypothetical protein